MESIEYEKEKFHHRLKYLLYIIHKVQIYRYVKWLSFAQMT